MDAQSAVVRMLAVDPSLTCTGWARFLDGRLDACGIIRTYRDDTLAGRLYSIDRAFRGVPMPDKLVIEWPQVYTRAKSKGDPNDMLPVAAVAGIVIASLSADVVLTPRPAEWKGQVPKDVHNARVMRRLTPEERNRVDAAQLPKSLANNAIDAIGLGLWALGRMGSNASNSDQETSTGGSATARRRAHGGGYAPRSRRG